MLEVKKLDFGNYAEEFKCYNCNFLSNFIEYFYLSLKNTSNHKDVIIFHVSLTYLVNIRIR